MYIIYGSGFSGAVFVVSGGHLMDDHPCNMVSIIKNEQMPWREYLLVFSHRDLVGFIFFVI